ncbi:hypothetical protein V6Z11_A01G009700 [Gossypium hirsutum]
MLIFGKSFQILAWLNNGLNGKSGDFVLTFHKFNYLHELYAFDVHCNSFFPMFVMLYVIHYFLSPLLVAHGFIPAQLSNLLFMVAASYHHYLNFLGYDVLPFLERTFFSLSDWHRYHSIPYLDFK